MLSNAYFLAKFRFDTAENEPAKNLQNFQKNVFFGNAFFENPPLDLPARRDLDQDIPRLDAPAFLLALFFVPPRE